MFLNLSTIIFQPMGIHPLSSGSLSWNPETRSNTIADLATQPKHKSALRRHTIYYG